MEDLGIGALGTAEGINLVVGGIVRSSTLNNHFVALFTSAQSSQSPAPPRFPPLPAPAGADAPSLPTVVYSTDANFADMNTDGMSQQPFLPQSIRQHRNSDWETFT